ncbi:hypothetical protein ACGFZU_35210 [Streptomyces tendae]|uniref:hypothetical protein n=1 Tax=Streptomyces tendae TaxID=1932 RepID=UPI00371A028B
MSDAIDTLAREALSSLTAAGFTGALIVRHSDTVLLASVPDTRRKWADVALKSFTCLPLADAGGRARYALFTAPEDTEPYSRTVHFRATGDGIPRQFADRPLVYSVPLFPGYSTEADIPKVLAQSVLGALRHADNITITRI